MVDVPTTVFQTILEMSSAVARKITPWVMTLIAFWKICVRRIMEDAVMIAILLLRLLFVLVLTVLYSKMMGKCAERSENIQLVPTTLNNVVYRRTLAKLKTVDALTIVKTF